MARLNLILFVFLFGAGCKKAQPVSPAQATPVLRDLTIIVDNRNNICRVRTWVDSGSPVTILPNTRYDFTKLAHSVHTVTVEAINDGNNCYNWNSPPTCTIDYSDLDQFAAVNGYSVGKAETDDGSSNVVRINCYN